MLVSWKKNANKFNPTLLLIFQIELGKGLGKDGLSIKALWEAGYESIFIGIGKISSIFWFYDSDFWETVDFLFVSQNTD